MAGESAQNVFQAVIQAVDQASGPIQAIINSVKKLTGAEEHAGTEEKDLHAKGVQEARQHGHAFHALSAHVRILQGHFGNLTASLGEFGQKFSELLPAFAGLGAAGSIVGLFEMTNKAAESFSALAATATQAGVSIQTFSALSLAAKENDIPVEQLRTSLFNLSKIMGGAVAGSNKKAAELFQHLGISLRDAHGHALSAAQVLPKLADAFKNIQNPTTRAMDAQILFGGRAGSMLLPILMKGSSGLEEYAKAWAKVGYAPTGAAAAGLEAFHASWIQLTTAVEGFSAMVGASLAPVLKPVVDLATKWVSANREWIASSITDAVRELSIWVEKIRIHAVITEMTDWITSIRDVVSAVGGAKLVIGGVALALGVPIISAIGSAIEIFKALRVALIAVGEAAWANPILIAVGAVSLAAYELYEHWAFVKQKVGAVFDWFGHQSGWVQALLVAVAPVIFIPMEIARHWTAITGVLSGIWTGIKIAWDEQITAIKAIIGGLTTAFDAVWADIAPIIARIQAAVQWVEKSWIGRHVLGGPGMAAPGSGMGMELAAEGGGAAPSPLRTRPGPFRGPHAGRAGAPVQARVHGQVHTTITFKNAPPGMRVESRAEGNAATPEVALGFAAPAFGY